MQNIYRDEAITLHPYLSYMNEMKHCSKCKSMKLKSEFRNQKSHKSGLASACKQCCRQSDQKDRIANCERNKATKRYNYMRHRITRIAKNNEWRENHPEQLKAIWVSDSQKRRAVKRNAPGNGVTAEQWSRILYACNNRCTWCGAEGKLAMDHVIPLSKGGAHDVKNVVPACGSCNSQKHANDLMTFLERKYGSL